jgi:SnoaL-like domain
VDHVTDHVKVLTELNLQFIDAWRKGAWELLDPILSPEFSYLDGVTGEVTDREQYRRDVLSGAAPTIGIDQVVVHVDGQTAVVSARSFRGPSPESFKRYADTYELRDGEWTCVHACLWPIP